MLGKSLGKAEAILELLEDYGSIPEQMKNTIFVEKNPETIKKWHKLAARVTSIEEFAEKNVTIILYSFKRERYQRFFATA